MSSSSITLTAQALQSQEKPVKIPLQGVSKRVLDLLQSDGSFANKKELQKYLSTIDVTQVAEALNPIMDTILLHANPQKALEQLAEFFPMEKLQECVKQLYPNTKDALLDAKKMLSEARFYLGAEEKISPTLRAKLSDMLDSIIIAIEGILSAFGIAEFFKSADNDLHAQVKAQQIMMLMTLFSLISATLLPVLGAAMAGMVVGGTLLFIATLSLVYPYFRPLPSRLPKAENWTKDYQLGKLDVVRGRESTVQGIATALTSKAKLKQHPMILGKSGAGKTETIKALVHAIEQGQYPELKGMKVFYFNTATLVSDSGLFGGGNKIIEKIKEAVGRHKGKVILVFDEIHLACKKKYAAIGSELLTMLDPKAENFPYFIGLTTQENFDRHVMTFDKAFARRFKIFNLENPDGQDVEEILNRSYLSQAPGIILEQGAMNYLKEQTRKAFPSSTEPAGSLKILKNCIQATASSQKSPLEEKVEALRKKIRSIHGTRSVTQAKDRCLSKESQIDVDALEADLRVLEVELEKEKEDLACFFAQREELGAFKRKMYEMVLKVGQLNSVVLSSKNRIQVNTFTLLDKFFIPYLESAIQKKATELNIQTMIDKALIDKEIQAEKAHEARMNALAEAEKRSTPEKIDEKR